MPVSLPLNSPAAIGSVQIKESSETPPAESLPVQGHVASDSAVGAQQIITPSATIISTSLKSPEINDSIEDMQPTQMHLESSIKRNDNLSNETFKAGQISPENPQFQQQRQRYSHSG
jgi:hypothetical protein